MACVCLSCVHPNQGVMACLFVIMPIGQNIDKLYGAYTGHDVMACHCVIVLTSPGQCLILERGVWCQYRSCCDVLSL